MNKYTTTFTTFSTASLRKYVDMILEDKNSLTSVFMNEEGLAMFNAAVTELKRRTHAVTVNVAIWECFCGKSGAVMGGVAQWACADGIETR